jgi:hypothetical protein
MRMVYAHTAEISQLFEDAVNTDLASGLEQIKVLLNRPRANNPAGWINKLWDCWCYCLQWGAHHRNHLLLSLFSPLHRSCALFCHR